MKIDVLKTAIPAEKTAQILLTVGRPAIAMAVVGQWEKKVPYLHSVFVGKGHRRKGLARAMVRKAMLLAQQAGKLSLNLWVDKRNRAAISLYASEGFTVVGNENPTPMNHNLRAVYP